MDPWRLQMLCVVALLAPQCRSVLYFDGCTEGSLDIAENTNHSFLCAGYNAKKLSWMVKGTKGERLYSGVCNEQTCGPANNRFNLTAKWTGTSYSSWLTITGITRDSGLNLRCNTAWIIRECKLRVIVPVRIVQESCSVKLSGWSVSGWCTLEWMNTHNMPSCTWRLLYQNTIQSLKGSTNSARNDAQDYRSANCSFVHELIAVDGNYTYGINISSHPADQYSNTIQIEKPDDLKHNCPDTVLEGSNINCTCDASKKGYPPGEITWIGSNSENFVIKNVSRKSNGLVGVCRLTWGDMNITALYHISISYGPTATYINSNMETSQGKTQRVLICTAIDVYPSAVFYWNITCENKTGNINTSTCTISTPIAEEKMAVECTAKNRIFSELFSSSTYILNGEITVENNEKSTSAANVQGGLIGGVVTAVLVIAVIVAVALVYIIKRRKEAGESGSERSITGFLPDLRKHLHGTTRLSMLYAVVNKPKTETPAQHLVTPSGDLHTIACTTEADKGNDEYSVVCKTIENRRQNKESDGDDQAKDASHEASKRKETIKPTIMLKPSIPCKETFQETSESSYVNVTKFPTDFGLGVYHRAHCTTNSGSSKPDTNEQKMWVRVRKKTPVYDTARRPAVNEHNYEDFAKNGRKTQQPAGLTDDSDTRQNENKLDYEVVNLEGQSVSQTPDAVFVVRRTEKI